MQEHRVFQALAGPEGLGDAGSEVVLNGDIHVDLPGVVFARAAVRQRHEIDVAPVVPLVGDLAAGEEGEERQRAAERQDAVRILSGPHGVFGIFRDESRHIEQLFRKRRERRLPVGCRLDRWRRLFFRLLGQNAGDVHNRERGFTPVVAAGIAQFAELVPVVAGAGVVMTAEGDGSVGLLDQDGRAIPVRIVERADGKHPLAAILPHLWLTELRTEPGNPGIQIEIRHLPW